MWQTVEYRRLISRLPAITQSYRAAILSWNGESDLAITKF